MSAAVSSAPYLDMYQANGQPPISVSSLPSPQVWTRMAADEDDGEFGLDLFMQDESVSLDLAEEPPLREGAAPAVPAAGSLEERVRTALREAADPVRETPFISMGFIDRLVHRKCDEFGLPPTRRLAFLQLAQAAFRLAVERLRGTIMNRGAHALLAQLQSIRSTPLDRKQFPYYEPSEWNHISEENATAAAQNVLLRYSRACGRPTAGPARFPSAADAAKPPLSALGVMLTTTLKAQVALAASPVAPGDKVPILNQKHASSVILAYTYGLSILADSGGRAVAYVGAIGVSPTPEAYWASVYEAFHAAPPLARANAMPESLRAFMAPLDSPHRAHAMANVVRQQATEPPPASWTVASAAGSPVEEEVLDHEEYGTAPLTPGGEEPLSQVPAVPAAGPKEAIPHTYKRRFEEITPSERPQELAAPPAKRARIERPVVPAAGTYHPPLFVSAESPLRLPWTPGFLALIRATLSLAIATTASTDNLIEIARTNVKPLQEAMKNIPGGDQAYRRARIFLMLFVINAREVAAQKDCVDALYGPPRHVAEEDDDAMDLDAAAPAVAPTPWTPQIMPPAEHRIAIFTYMTMLREVAPPAWALEFRQSASAFFTGMRQPVSESTAVAVWQRFLSVGPEGAVTLSAHERGLATAALYMLLSACFSASGPQAAAKLKADWKLSPDDLEM